jgi:hypothetical protein
VYNNTVYKMASHSHFQLVAFRMLFIHIAYSTHVLPSSKILDITVVIHDF